jgi:hypothetical protein
VVELLGERSAVDSLTLARIQKDRDAALARHVRDRDPGALESEMTRLDAQEADAHAVTGHVDPSVPLDYLG